MRGPPSAVQAAGASKLSAATEKIRADPSAVGRDTGPTRAQEAATSAARTAPPAILRLIRAPPGSPGRG